MDQKLKTLRRLGVAGLGAVIALGTSAVGFTGVASAQAPDQSAAVAWTAPTIGSASTLSDGTNTSVKLEVVQSAINTGAGNPALTSVRFDYTQTADGTGAAVAGTETTIGTATTAPYTLAWTPPSAGTYTLTAEPLASGGGSAGSVETEPGVVVKATYPSVHISSPTDGSTIPYFNTDGDNYVSVSGTRSNGSDGLPAIAVDATLYDVTATSDSYGTLGDTVTTDLVPSNANPAAGASQAWEGAVQVPADCPAADACDVVLHAVASDAAGSSDESVVSALGVAQTLSPTGLAVSPTSSVTITDSGTAQGTDVSSQAYTVTATDTNGKPIAGLTVLAYGNQTTDTINGTAGSTSGSPVSAVTDANGQATFTASDSADQTSTLTFETAVNGTTYSAANDDSTTRTLVTTAHVARTLAAVTLTKVPAESVYASQSYSQSYPVLSACLTDQLGQPFHSTSTLIGLDTRTESPAVNNPTVSFGTEEQTNSVNNGCFPVILSGYPASEVTGSDAITVYQEGNGQTGFQPGSTDIGAQTTVNFAPGVIAFDNYTNCTDDSCITQAQAGTVKTITVNETVGGTAAAGQLLTLSIGGNASFPATQPSGTTVANGNNQLATCTTGTDGSCKVNVSDASTESETLYAADGQGLDGDINVEFRASTDALVLGSADLYNNATLYPSGDGGTTVEDYGTPGTIMVDSYHLFDTDGHILSDVPVTVSINHGFFTPIPTNLKLNGEDSSGDYNTGSFSPAPAAGGVVGTPMDIGTAVTGGGETLTAVSNNFGVVHFATSIGRDSGFDTDGHVLTDVKVTANGTTVDAGNPAGNEEPYTWTTDSQDTVDFPDNNGDTLGDVVPGGALNGASVKIIAAPGESLTGNQTDTPYNEAADAVECANNTDPCSGDALSFDVQLTDQFGNLVSAPTTVTDTTGNFYCDNDNDNQNQVYGSYTGNDEQDYCSVYSDGSPDTATADTVTDTWNTQTTLFGTNPNTATGAPALAAIVNNATSVTKTDSFTVDLYSVDLAHLSYTDVVVPTPSNGAVKTGTTVHDEITVSDQYSHPVQGLFVTFDQSGPGAGVDNRASDFTDTTGTASDNFSSSIQGDATVTSDVYESCFQFTGNEGNGCSPSTTGGVPLSENVNTVGFDGVPTIAVTPTSHQGAVTVTVSGFTRPGAKVQLLAKASGGAAGVSGAAITAGTDGSYSFSRHITKSTVFETVIDGIQASPAKVVTITTKKKIVEKPTETLASTKAGKLTVNITTHPSLANKTVDIYSVSASGARHLLGSVKTHSGGKATKTLTLTKGKTYKVVVRVAGLSTSTYTSEYSSAHSKKVKK